MNTSGIVNTSVANFSAHPSTLDPLTHSTVTDPEVWRKSLPTQLSLGALGIIGNLLNLLVFTRPAFAKLSTSVFLCTLAIMDILLLIVFNTCTTHAYIINPNPSSLAQVRFHPVGQWFLISFATSSAWTIVSLSVERAIAVTIPLKVRAICTRRNAIITCCSLVLILFIINVPTLIVKPGRHDVLPLPLYFTILYSVLPSSIIVFCNVILVYKINKRHTNEQRKVENRGLTIMLIVNSLGFVGLTLPYSIFHLMGHRITDQIHIVRLLKILESLGAMNHCVNFIFYGLGGSLFKRELKMILCGKCLKGKGKPGDRALGTLRDKKSTSEDGKTSITSVNWIGKDQHVATDSGVGSELNEQSASGGSVEDIQMKVDKETNPSEKY